MRDIQVTVQGHPRARGRLHAAGALCHLLGHQADADARLAPCREVGALGIKHLSVQFRGAGQPVGVLCRELQVAIRHLAQSRDGLRRIGELRRLREGLQCQPEVVERSGRILGRLFRP